MTHKWWNVGWAPTPEEWSAVWGLLALLATVGALAIALLQLRSYFQERFERSRPVVLVDFVFKASIILQVAVQNVSQTPAANLSLRVDPPFEATGAEDAEILNRIHSSDFAITHLGPGRELKWTLDRAPDYFNNQTLPRQYVVTARYEDPRAPAGPTRWWRFLPPNSYEEKFVLDIRQYDQASADTDYENRNWNIQDRNERRFGRIAAALEQLVSQGEPDEK